MKKWTIIITFIYFINLSYAQDIKEIFKAFPLEYTPELSQSGKDSILQYGEYIIPGGDSVNTSKYDYYNENENYIRLEYSFTTGQNGFFMIQLKKFKKENGDIIVVYTKHGGMLRAYDQHELIVFNYLNKHFTINKIIKLPSTIEPKVFLSRKLQKDTQMEYSKSISTGYDLNPQGIN